MRKIAWLLVLLTVGSALAGCGAADEVQTETTAKTETEISEATETEISDDLPDMDYGGADYRIYTRNCCNNGHIDAIYMPEQTGDVVSDAVYDRNLTVEERFNIHITEPITGSDGEATDLNNSVQAGDDMCEVVIWHYKHLGDTAAAGYLTDLASTEYLGFDKPWWYQKVNEAYSVGGHAYVLVGMYDLDNYLDNVCVYFNKEMMIDLHGDVDLYSVVKEGKWTIDALEELAVAAAIDLDGDGIMDPTKDQFGYGQANGFGFVYQFAWEQPVTTRDNDGYPYDAINTERMVTMTETFKALCDADYTVFDESNTAATVFKEGRELFQLDSLKASSNSYRDMEEDFGILPVAKLNEDQSEYYTHATAHTSAVAIPVVKDQAGLEYSSIILEAMAAEGYKQVRPAVYEVALKSKYTRDADSYEMIDIVVQGRTADFADVYDKWGLTYTLDYIARGNVKEWASYYASQNKTQTKNIEDVVELFKKLEEK